MYCVSQSQISLKNLDFNGNDKQILDLKDSKAAKIKSEKMAEILQSKGVKFTDKSGGEVVFVKDCDALNLVQQAFLQEITNEYANIKFIKFPAISPQNELPKDFGAYKFQKLFTNKITQKGTFRASFRTPSGGSPSIFFRYEIDAQLPVLRATKPIMTKQVLGIGDFASSWAGLDEHSPDMMSEPPGVRLVAKQNIKSGEVLKFRQFNASSLIKKGERVQAVLSDGALSIIIEVVALENGNLGDTIKVKNSEKKSFSAQVISKKQVMIR